MMVNRWPSISAQTDVEKQITASSKATVSTVNHDVMRITALSNLFKTRSGQEQERVKERRLEQAEDILEEWPGLRGYCRYIEDCFKPLLEDKYACVWTTIGVQRPVKPIECWSLFNALYEAVKQMGQSATIAKILDSMTLSTSNRIDADKADCLVATFSVLCWSTMTLQPILHVPEQSAPGLFARRDSGSEQIRLKLDTVYRPIVAAFRGSLHNQPSGPWRHSIRDTGEERSTVLHVSTLNFRSLQDIGKIRMRWVNDLSSHLDFDSRKKELAVFRFPSFCAMTAASEKNCTVFEEYVAKSHLEPPRVHTDGGYRIARGLYSANPDTARDFEYFQQLNQEVLMSYRLLFGQRSGSRKRIQNELQKVKQRPDYDELLEGVCGHSHNHLRKLPSYLWPASCRSVVDEKLQEEDTYSSQDDFPLLGQRLSKLQEYNLRQQPSRLRDLWRDRRAPLQWYTFWAVIIFGSISILIAVFQLAVSIVAIPTTQNCNCN